MRAPDGEQILSSWRDWDCAPKGPDQVCSTKTLGLTAATEITLFSYPQPDQIHETGGGR